MNRSFRRLHGRSGARIAAVFLACTTFAGSSFAAGEFIPKLTPGSQTFPTGINARSETEGLILPGGEGFKFIGRTSFAGTGVRVFGRSQSTVSSDGTSNFFESRLGKRSIDNPAYSNGYLQCPGGLSAFYRLAVKELAANGQGSVELDFRFDAPVKDLHLVVFDIDELAGRNRESVIVNAYHAYAPRIANKINAAKWRVVAQGDLSLKIGARSDQITLPPLWYAINADVQNNFGLLQARSRLGHETISNQNRDYTVMTMPDAVRTLRVFFRGPRAERRGARPEIGSHTYVGLWHPSQPCGY